jgi:phosphoribosyl-AMP cyclohydrolase
MDGEAFRRTLETGFMHYHSRSRGKLWLKGESSGHLQRVVEARIDCDLDALLFLVDQTGAACHTGATSCFYRTVDELGDKSGEEGMQRHETHPVKKEDKSNE